MGLDSEVITIVVAALRLAGLFGAATAGVGPGSAMMCAAVDSEVA